ncbi:MAG TPA: ABC transporter substrate-binding protein [Polyangiales bacterium]
MSWCAIRARAALLLLCVACCVACSGPAARPRDADALVVLLPRDVQELDPRFVSDAYGHKLSRLIFASLVGIDPQTLEAEPELAERIERVSDTEYRVTLRAGLRFSDGSALLADDVVATFASVVDPKLATRYASEYSRLTKVEALDDLTIRFVLSGPHATFLTDLELPIVRSQDAAHHIAALSGEPLIGAGPYTLGERSHGRYELRANPYWLHGKPIFPQLRMLVVRDDNTRALRLLAGAADLALNAVPAGLLPLFVGRAGFEVRSAPGIGTTYLGVNTRAGPLRDVRVRRALAHAIDRQALVDAKLGGRAQLARTFVPPGHWAFDPQAAVYEFSPARARQLLEEAGFPTQPRDGVRLRLSLRCGSDRFRYSIARAIAAMLADVGIAIELRPSETATLISELDRGQFELTMLQVPEVIEPHVLSWFFGSSYIPGPGHEGANRWRYSNPVLDAAFERGRTTMDRAQRREAYAQVQRILASELPVIPLWHEDVVAVTSARARKFVAPRDGRFSTLAR